MKKGSRLSFRISSKLDNTIEKAIAQSQGEIRDRSEFGLKSIIHFLNYLAHTKSEEQVLMATILKLAESKNIKTKQIKMVNSIYNEKLKTIRELDVKTEHPNFSELLTIIDLLPLEIQEGFLARLDGIEYGGIENFLKEVRDYYYLKGKGSITEQVKVQPEITK